MKKNGKWVILTGLMIVLFNIMPYITKAQIIGPEGDPDAPLDGGISLLLAAGVGYGLRKAVVNKNKDKKSIKID